VVEADRVAADLAEWVVVVLVVVDLVVVDLVVVDLVVVDLVVARAAIALSRCLVRWAAAVPALVAAIGR
jgi:hypothetical protein